MVGVGWSSRSFAEKSVGNRCGYTNSFAASDVDMYSAFVVDNVVHS